MLIRYNHHFWPYLNILGFQNLEVLFHGHECSCFGSALLIMIYQMLQPQKKKKNSDDHSSNLKALVVDCLQVRMRIKQKIERIRLDGY